MTTQPFFKKPIWRILVAIITINVVAYFCFFRLDLTQDQRYTLSAPTLSVLEKIQTPVYIEIYLEGTFPGEFKRLQDETRQLLDEYHSENNLLQFVFINPLENAKEQNQVLQKFYTKGMMPVNITVDDKGKQTQELVFPWAEVSTESGSARVALLKNLMGATTEQKVISSVQHLEYAFTEAIAKVTASKQKKIAILKGNGVLEDYQIADFLKTIRDNYFIAPFSLEKAAQNPIAAQKALQEFDLIVMAKPTKPYTDIQKQLIDQYIMNGGKGLFLIENVKADMDSLYNETGTLLAFPVNTNLEDLFFKYGIRINQQLVKDEQATPIKLASGNEGSQTQYQNYVWKYAPFIYPKTNHPIVKNTDGVKLEFTNPIDTLKNNIKKTILLESSSFSKKIGTPTTISLSSVSEAYNPNAYLQKDSSITAVLLEGKFTSAFKNRILSFAQQNVKTNSTNTKIIVVSDGDIIKNQMDKNGVPLELGFDKWTNNLFGNKEFILNSVNYLLDDKGLIQIRNKDVSLPLLNKQKVYDNYTMLQVQLIVLPILLLGMYSLIFIYFRKRKYQK